MAEEKRNGIKAHKARIDKKEQIGSKKSSIQQAVIRMKPEPAEKPTGVSKRTTRTTNSTSSARRIDTSNMTDEERRRYAARRRAKQKRRRKRKIQRIILIVIMILMIVFAFMILRAIGKAIFGHKSKKEPQATEQVVEKGEATATITTAGDIVMHSPIFESSNYYDGTTYDFNPIFQYMKDTYEAADFTVLTTEFAMIGGEYTGYPTFNSPDEIAEALANNGIDMCLLANNHIYDYGDDGVKTTMEVYEKNNILTGGVRKSAAEKNYIIQDINGIKIGFFDYVFQTEDGGINGIPLSDEGKDIVNSFDEEHPQSLYDDMEKGLKEMEEEGVEYTVAYLHWGIEYQTHENELQDAIAQKLCDMGIDALIASHPHVIQPVDLLESGDHQMLCCYAIGNHLSNQRTEFMDGIVNGYSEDGMTVTIKIARDAEGNISLETVKFLPTWVYLDSTDAFRYLILPLDDPEGIMKTAGVESAKEEIEASVSRTKSITGAGIKKVKDALPIVRKPAPVGGGKTEKSETADEEKSTEDSSQKAAEEEV